MGFPKSNNSLETDPPKASHTVAYLLSFYHHMPFSMTRGARPGCSVNPSAVTMICLGLKNNSVIGAPGDVVIAPSKQFITRRD